MYFHMVGIAHAGLVLVLYQLYMNCIAACRQCNHLDQSSAHPLAYGYQNILPPTEEGITLCIQRIAEWHGLHALKQPI